MSSVQCTGQQEARLSGLIVLVIDSDPLSGDRMAAELLGVGYAVMVAGSVMQGLTLARELRPALVITESSLPDGDGKDVVTRLSPTGMPVIVVTQRNDLASKVMMLDLGAADYVVKPFEAREFLVRIAVQVRKRYVEWEGEVLVVGELTLHVQQRLVLFRKKAVHLARKEREVLAVLMSEPGRVFSAWEVVECIWGTESTRSGALIAGSVATLRRKLQAADAFGYLVTVHGSGYVIREKKVS